jgi:4-hydroxybenzoate polyprenyltransferase
MSPLTVGAGVAAVMAGPMLYSLVEHGQLDGTTAVARGLLVAAVCAVAASYLQGMINQFDREADRKHESRLRLLAEAEMVLRAKNEAEAKKQSPDQKASS